MRTPLVTMREENEGSRLERLPAGRRERTQIVAVGHGGQTGEDVAEVGQRIDSVTTTGDHQRVDLDSAVESLVFHESAEMRVYGADQEDGGDSPLG